MKCKNILEELYYGNINPIENYSLKPLAAKYSKIISDNEEKLMSFFNRFSAAKEEHELFSQLLSAQIDLLDYNEFERFIEGFRLGARFTLDTFFNATP